MGVPVIATTAEGLPELIRDGESGHLVPVGDVAAMAHRGIEILSDSARHAALAAAARQVSVERYDVGRIIPMYEAFYERVAGSTAGASGPVRG